jgi:hypothetical protein
MGGMTGVLMWVLGAACTQRTVYDQQVVEPHLMDDAQYVRRLSLDIRGTVPTLDEWTEFDAQNPQDTIDIFLEHEGFAQRIRDIYAPIYRTVTDEYNLIGADFQWDDEVAFRRSIGEEPLRLLSYVATSDLPWTTIVTADYTMANAVLGSIFPVAYEENVNQDWQPVPYIDGRPMAGVLSSNALWWRFGSTGTNANRMRANVVSTILLCNNYLSRPISFERDSTLLDEDAMMDAIHNDPACVNCHRTLDPLAAHLFGFWNYQSDSWLESSIYHSDRERLWQTYLETPPEFFGQPSAGFTDLGRLIASDSRFPNCATEQMTSALLQQSLDFSDAVRIMPHREAFLSSGLNMKALVASIVQSEAYRAGKWNDGVDVQNRKLLSLPQLVSSIEALTGFRWTYGDFNMLENDIVGLRSLAGGVDGRSAGREARVPNATMILVQGLLAEQASAYRIQQEVDMEVSDRIFFPFVTLDSGIDADEETLMSARLQVQHLHRVTLTQEVSLDGSEVSAGLELWRAVYTLTGDAIEAWTVLTTALLRDPNYLLY